MTTMLSPNDSIRMLNILRHKDMTRGTYTAYCTDKFVLWYDLKSLQDLIRFIEEDCKVPQLTGKDVADRYSGWIAGMVNVDRCTIVPSAVDCVGFETDVRTFTPNTPATLRNVQYYKIRLHMKLYGQPLIHPKYGEHIGWTASVLEV